MLPDQLLVTSWSSHCQIPASSALEYEPIGSLAGTLRAKNGAVDFGASDVPLKSDELAKLGLGQFPIVIGGVVVVVNIDGVGAGEIKFTGPVLGGVSWQDQNLGGSRHQGAQSDLKLPDAAIAVIRRSDGSGTTFNFTDYLSKVSPAWKETVGSDLLVSWPTGTGARGNEGVAQAVKRVKNSIGYVEYAQALQTQLSFALLQNQAGKFIKPDVASFQAAAASADWETTSDFYLLLTNVPASDAYPIVATVFVLMPKAAAPQRTRAAFDFFQWSLERGAKDAAQLGYVALPDRLVTQVKSYWAKHFKAGT